MFVITVFPNTSSNVPVDVHCLVHGKQKAQLTGAATDSSIQLAKSDERVELPPPRSSFTYWTMTIGWENAKVSLETMSRMQGSPSFPGSLVTR